MKTLLIAALAAFTIQGQVPARFERPARSTCKAGPDYLFCKAGEDISAIRLISDQQPVEWFASRNTAALRAIMGNIGVPPDIGDDDMLQIFVKDDGFQAYRVRIWTRKDGKEEFTMQPTRFVEPVRITHPDAPADIQNQWGAAYWRIKADDIVSRVEIVRLAVIE